MGEEVGDGFAVVSPADGFGESAADVDDRDLGAAFRLVAEGHGVGDDDAGEGAVVDGVDGLAAEDAVWEVLAGNQQ